MATREAQGPSSPVYITNRVTLDTPVEIEEPVSVTVQDPVVVETHGEIVAISFENNEIYTGNHFTATEVLTLNKKGDQREILVTTADTDKVPHFLFTIGASFSALVEFFEGSSKVGGVTVPSFNNNRRSANVADTLIAHSPGGSGDGTLIYVANIGQGEASKVGGVVHPACRFLLARSTKYLLRITAGAAKDVISTEFSWYEC